MPRINRFNPDTCSCVVEREVDDKGQIQFLLMNRVCTKHKPLASTEYKAEHSQLASHVLDLIAEAKAVNLKQVDDLIANETSNFRKKDLIECRQIVLNFNARLDEEWAELVQPPHAFDVHIHDQIFNVEQLAKQKAMISKQFEGI